MSNACQPTRLGISKVRLLRNEEACLVDGVVHDSILEGITGVDVW
jgi:hypothetical protein